MFFHYLFSNSIAFIRALKVISITADLYLPSNQWRTQEKFSRVKVMTGIKEVQSPVAKPPDAAQFPKNLEKVLRNIAKMHCFRQFFQKIKKDALNFRAS